MPVILCFSFTPETPHFHASELCFLEEFGNHDVGIKSNVIDVEKKIVIPV